MAPDAQEPGAAAGGSGPPPELSVVVVHHRVPDVLLAALTRLTRGAPDAEVVLVDTDPDPALVLRARRVLPALVALAAPNHSYAFAANVGIKRARGRFVALMNPDVYLETDTLPRLLAVLRGHPTAGVAAPVARTPAGRRQDHGPLFHPNYLRLALAPGGSVRVAWVPGYLHLVRREALSAAGGLDASLRFYNEDADFCRRLRRAGFHARLVDAPVLHLGGSSTPASPAFLVEGLRGGYQLSRRYLPRPLRRAHRRALLAWARLAAAWASGPDRRDAYRAVAAMARSGRFDEPPFGATLTDPPHPPSFVPDEHQGRTGA